MGANSHPVRLSVWVLAARPKTLWASVAPVIVGTAVALRDGAVHWPSACAALLGSVLIQIGTNFANDLFDHVRGADTPEREGPLRVTQAGLVTLTEIRNAMIGALAIAFVIGVYLVSRGGWPIVFIGLLSIAAAILYTGGPYPFGYYGWGDFFVFIFFGPVAVLGTYFVQAHTTTPDVWLASLPMGALATAILVINNIRDIDTDRKAGKKTLAVRLGRFGSVGEYSLMLAIAIACPIVMVVALAASIWSLAASAVTVAFVPILLHKLRSQTSPLRRGVILNETLAMTAQLKLIYAIVFAIGINL